MLVKYVLTQKYYVIILLGLSVKRRFLSLHCCATVTSNAMLRFESRDTPKAAFAEIMKQLSTEIVQQTLSADIVHSASAKTC